MDPRIEFYKVAFSQRGAGFEIFVWQIEIEFNEVPNDKPQEIKLHNVATTQQKLHLWLVIII